MREHLLLQLDSAYAGYYKGSSDYKSSDIFPIPPMSPPLPTPHQNSGVCNGGDDIMPEGFKTSENGNKNSLNCSVEDKTPMYRLLSLNKPEMLYLIVGMVSGIITGLLPPAEGFFISNITVSVNHI